MKTASISTAWNMLSKELTVSPLLFLFALTHTVELVVVCPRAESDCSIRWRSTELTFRGGGEGLLIALLHGNERELIKVERVYLLHGTSAGQAMRAGRTVEVDHPVQMRRQGWYTGGSSTEDRCTLARVEVVPRCDHVSRQISLVCRA